MLPGRRPSSPPLLSVALALMAMGLGVLEAGGQERITLRGKVLHADTRMPLEGVLVTAPLADISVLTDSLGVFELDLVRDRAYELVAEDLGYLGVRFTLEPETDEASTTILLPPDRAMLSALAVLDERLQQRRRRWSSRIRLLEHDSLMVSTEINAYRLVERSIPLARMCERQRENLCLLGGARERVIRVCVDDERPPAGASALASYEPSDLWLVEIYNNGDRVRVYSRWFVSRIARMEGGNISSNPACR